MDVLFFIGMKIFSIDNKQKVKNDLNKVYYRPSSFQFSELACCQMNGFLCGDWNINKTLSHFLISKLSNKE